MLSLANQTDLAFYGRFGEVIDRGEYVLVRTPDSPQSYLGNQLIVLGDLRSQDLSRWLGLFRDEFADLSAVRHVTLNVQGAIDQALDESQAQLTRKALVVMSCARPFPVTEPRNDLAITRLNDDAQWNDFVEWRYAQAKESTRDYFRRHFLQQRELADAGRAAWFCARLADAPAASLGIVGCDGVARFQAITTEPSYRRRGIASYLMKLALSVADRELAASRAVIVVREDNLEAMPLYTKLGFSPVGRQAFVCSW